MIKNLIPFLFLVLTQVNATEPAISSVLPRGGQLGSTQNIVITGQRLKDAEEIFFYEKGITAIEIVEEKETKLSAKFVISADAKIGQHELRLRTKKGLSKLFTFWVGPYPNLDEKEPNSSFEDAQSIPMNVTVNGVAQNEDVDYFEINATQGQRISAEVEAIRLSGPLFDPYVAILDENRFEIATSDDSELLLQDSTTSVIAPKTGKYYVEVRETSYRGNGSFRYRVHIGSFPRPLVVTPAGGEAGKEIEFTFLGDPKGPFKKTITLPNNGEKILAYHHDENGLRTPSANNIRISKFPAISEIEPNNSFSVATKTELSIPLAFDGVIQEDGDIDCFRFQARKGDRYYIKAHARSVASPLDPVLNLYYGDGKSIRGNDDASNGPDSLITRPFQGMANIFCESQTILEKGAPCMSTALRLKNLNLK